MKNLDAREIVREVFELSQQNVMVAISTDLVPAPEAGLTRLDTRLGEVLAEFEEYDLRQLVCYLRSSYTIGHLMPNWSLMLERTIERFPNDAAVSRLADLRTPYKRVTW